MCEDGSHVQRSLMGNHSSLMNSKFIPPLFIWGQDHSQQRNGMKVAIKKRKEQKDNSVVLINS